MFPSWRLECTGTSTQIDTPAAPGNDFLKQIRPIWLRLIGSSTCRRDLDTWFAVLAVRLKNWENVPMRPSEALAARRDQVLSLAASRGARAIRVFGSVAKGVDREGSDLDLLVDLPLGTSLLSIVGLQLEIEDALGVKVDLCTERELDPALKERILAEARPL